MERSHEKAHSPRGGDAKPRDSSESAGLPKAQGADPKDGGLFWLAPVHLEDTLKSLRLRAAGILIAIGPRTSLSLCSPSDPRRRLPPTRPLSTCRAPSTPARPAGPSIFLPGTYYFDSQVVLKSGVTLQGAGIGQTILTMPAKSSQTNLLALIEREQCEHQRPHDLRVRQPPARCLALHLSNYSNVTIERVYVTGCEYALKADTCRLQPHRAGLQGSRLADRCTSPTSPGGCSRTSTSRLSQQYLYSVDFSALYLCAGNHDLTFNNFRARGGSGWTIQLWSDYGPTEASDNIEFNGLDVAGWGPLALGYDFSDVRIYNAVFGGGTERSCIRLYGLSDVLVDGFSATGGTQLVQCWAGATNYNVTLKNGTYSGTQARGSDERQHQQPGGLERRPRESPPRQAPPRPASPR